MDKELLIALQASLGITLRDPTLLETAMTHRSAAHEGRAARRGHKATDNERMEFLGDAVLSLCVSELLWRRLPQAREGELTRLRAAVVNETALARLSTSLGIGETLRLGRGEARTGGRTKPSLLADALEATLAAVYLDGGLDAARAVVDRLLTPEIDEALTRATPDLDDKTRLQELLQAQHTLTPRYEVVRAEGPDHHRTWEVEMIADPHLRTRGVGTSKKRAEQAAAGEALRLLTGGADVNLTRDAGGVDPSG